MMTIETHNGTKPVINILFNPGKNTFNVQYFDDSLPPPFLRMIEVTYEIFKEIVKI